jgi:hypothetical protein
MAIARYPADFSSSDSQIATDFVMFEPVRKNYNGGTSNGSSTYIYSNNAATNVFVKDNSSPFASTDSVALYMPQKITENYSQQWTNNTLGPEVGKLIAEGSTGLATNMLRKYLENYVMDAALNAAGKLGASSLTANAVLSATGGIIYNPMLEVLYDGPDFRRFNYQFMLFAKSDSDAQQIYKIVNFFRYCSVPSTESNTTNSTSLASFLTTGVLDAGGNAAGQALNGALNTALGQAANNANLIPATANVAGLLGGLATVGTGTFTNDQNFRRFIKQPPFVRITYKRNGSGSGNSSTSHPYIISPNPCALTNLNIDFTPTGNYTVLDNFGTSGVATVVATTISFTLTEVNALYQEDITNYLINA